MELFKNVRRQVASQLDQMKLAREIEQLSNLIRDNPSNVDALKRLAEAYQESGNLEAAISHFMRLADVYRSSKQYELALVFYRKVERMVESSQRATILKHIVNIYFETRQFDRAYEYCRQVIGLYLGEQQSEAAMGFLKMLPGFGEKDADYRKELREMIQERSEKWMQGAKATWVTEENSGRTQKDQEDFSDRLVVLVDDEPHVLMILEKIIKPLGCQIMTANNGLEALAIIRQHTPALIISDLMMPKMDGSQLFAALQDEPSLAKIPFVCLSSRAQEDEKVSALELGVEDYWAKPFSVKEIPLKVKRILKRQPTLARVGGQLSHTSVTDLLNQMERERKEGVVKIVTPNQEVGTIYFKDGAAVDAESGSFTGLAAIIHMVQWSDGSYAFTQQPVTRSNVINMRASELILEALHRYDEEQSLLATLPPRESLAVLPASFDVSWFAGFPMEKVRRLMTLLDGRHTVGQCIEQTHHDIDLIRMLSVIWSPSARESSPPAAPPPLAPTVEPPMTTPPPSGLPTSPSLPSYPMPSVAAPPVGAPTYPPSQPYYGGGSHQLPPNQPLAPQAPYAPAVQPPYYPPAPPYPAAYPAQNAPPAYPPAGQGGYAPPTYPPAGHGQAGYAPPPSTYAPQNYAPPYAPPAPVGSSGMLTAQPLAGAPPVQGGEYRVTFADPAAEQALAKQLYEAVVAAKRQCGESLQDFTFARFHQILCDQSAKIKSQLKCTHISFSVSVENGRVKFVAKGL
ncbi:response regulator [Chloracidobacterium validum]|uniref:Response regulator n=1 Tax=Chloracidobacterium validum TaxID=2821543 RepID=A0ABX8B9V4_9BACT|nr:response regulator [Chloracidobacterium validum]QUW03712.1 response regulator [Chloracidobacterium validum]